MFCFITCHCQFDLLESIYRNKTQIRPVSFTKRQNFWLFLARFVDNLVCKVLF